MGASVLLFAFQGKLYHYRVCYLEAVSWPSGGSALEHFYFAKCTGYWLGSLAKPSLTTFCAHSSKTALQKCSP